MGISLLAALPTSLTTCGEVFEASDNTRTRARLLLMASTIASAHSVPGKTSRGAIQQDMSFFSLSLILR